MMVVNGHRGGVYRLRDETTSRGVSQIIGVGDRARGSGSPPSTVDFNTQERRKQNQEVTLDKEYNVTILTLQCMMPKNLIKKV